MNINVLPLKRRIRQRRNATIAPATRQSSLLNAFECVCVCACACATAYEFEYEHTCCSALQNQFLRGIGHMSHSKTFVECVDLCSSAYINEIKTNSTRIRMRDSFSRKTIIVVHFEQAANVTPTRVFTPDLAEKNTRIFVLVGFVC